jgi:hypothetical protein
MERGKTRINIPRKMIVCGLDVVESGAEWNGGVWMNCRGLGCRCGMQVINRLLVIGLG